MSDNAWLLASIDRMKKADLLALIAAMPGPYAPYPRGAIKTCDAARAYLTLARQMHWEVLSRSHGGSFSGGDHKAQHRSRPQSENMCEVPASEVNAMLREMGDQ